MRKFIIAILFVQVVIHTHSYCQPNTFEYILSTPMNEVVGDIYEENDGSIYVTGFVTRPNEFWGKANGIVLKINDEGHFVDSTIYDMMDRRYCITNILPDSNNCFILSGYSTDTFPQLLNTFGNCCIEMKKINSNLDILSEKEIVFPPDYKYKNWISCRGMNNNILVSGSIVPNYIVPYLFFYVLKDNFDSLHASFYLDTTRMCGAIKQLSDTTYWMTDFSSSDYYMLDKNLYLTDYDYARPHWINSPFGIKWDSDTSFYLAGEWNDGPDDDIGFFKQFHPTDSTGNIFNTWGTLDTLDIPAADALDYKNKDSIFIGGTTNFGFYYFPTPSWYFIIQTDSNLNVRWERFYGGDAHYIMWKIIASNDGGCIIAGTRYDYQNVTEEELDIHILKLNSEGLMVGTPEGPTIEMHEALVFPNPGTNYLKVRIAAQHKQSMFELYDINGRQVLTQQIFGKWGEVNTVFLTSGTYIYKIYNAEGLHESGKWIKH